MSKLDFTPAIPIGETILVSGVTGYIAAQIADNLLSLGYRVRGTSRNPDNAQRLLQQFNQKYGSDKFDVVKVENVNAEGAFSEATKGVAGIIHVALDSNLTGEPEPYISNTINGSLSVLRTAKADPQIKRVVFTASSMGAVPWKTGVEYSFGVDAYNEDSIKKAYEPPFTPDKAFTVYGASKALTEKAIFKWLAEEKPSFVYNAVLPAVNFGFSASGPFGSTGGWAKSVSEGDWSTAQYVSPQFFVDINDTALIHVGALLHPDVQSERLFAFAEPQNWNTVLAKLRNLYPQQSFADDAPNLGHDLSHPPNDRALFVLKSLGAPGWKSLEQSLKEAFDTLYT